MKIWIVLLFIIGISTHADAQSLHKRDFFQLNGHSLIDNNEYLKPKLKNKNIALVISFGSFIAIPIITAASLYSFENNPQAIDELILLSLLPGPSMGYLYSYSYEEFRRSLYIRGIGVGLALVGSYIASIDTGNGIDGIMGSYLTLGSGGAIFLTGIVIYTYRTLKDFVGVRNKVGEYNQNLLNRVQITPIVDPVHKTAGVGLRVNL